MKASSGLAGVVLGTVVLIAGWGGSPLLTAAGASPPGAVSLGTLPGGSSSYATAVNDGGQLVGGSGTAASFRHAFSWTQAGGMVDLGTLPGNDYSIANAVNNSGQVVGTSGSPQHAFSWTANGGLVDLGALGSDPSADSSEALAVSDAGQVVGRSYNATTGEQHAFSWTPTPASSPPTGVMVDLGTLGGTSSEAHAVNASGLVVGTGDLTDALTHAFSWSQPGPLADLHTVGTDESSDAVAVNASGQIAGRSYTAGPSGPRSTAPPTGPPPAPRVSRPVLWAAGEMVDLGTLGGSYGGANSVNSSGQVVGFSDISPDGNTHGFSWTPTSGSSPMTGVIVDLGTLGGNYSEAVAVNDAGVAVGRSYITGNGEQHAFLWTRAGGMVDLGTAGSTSDARAVARCAVVGSEGNYAALWQLCPSSVVAGAGDASASVSWVPAADLGRGPATYTVAASPGSLTTTVSGSVTSATLPGLTNGTGYTFTVTASYGSGTFTSAPSTSVTPAAGAGTPSTVSGTVAAGGSISTDPGASPTALAPVSTSVTTPTGGDITIATTTPTDPAPAGYLFGNQQVNIRVVGPTPLASDPLKLVFTVHPLAGQTPDNTTIYRSEAGTPALVPPCDLLSAGQAVPDPCATIVWDATNAYVVATIYTTSASDWSVATPIPVGAQVTDRGYSPAKSTVQLGGSMAWTFTGARSHSVTEAVGLGAAGKPLFDSGPRRTGGYTPATPLLAAGDYAYKSTVKGDKMTGSVLVPVMITRSSQASPYVVIWATRQIPGYVFDVQYSFKANGSRKWTDPFRWQSRVSSPSATFVPTRGAGAYAFVAAVRNTVTGRSSAFSPKVTITVP